MGIGGAGSGPGVGIGSGPGIGGAGSGPGGGVGGTGGGSVAVVCVASMSRPTPVPGGLRATDDAARAAAHRSVLAVHRSRVYALLIDTPGAEADRAAAFWSAALGVTARPLPGEPQFTSLPGAVAGLATAVQAIDGPARFHLDIETDDPDAETARLVALGATPVTQWRECRVLRAPGGHLLCVLPVESDAETFAAGATTWP